MFVAGTNIVDSNNPKFSTILWSKLYIYWEYTYTYQN